MFAYFGLRWTNLTFDPSGEPIRPIDPAAWVSHTAAMTGVYPAYGMSPSMSTVTSTSSSISSSIPETERESGRHVQGHPVRYNWCDVIVKGLQMEGSSFQYD